jgi:hypothetical protein
MRAVLSTGLLPLKPLGDQDGVRLMNRRMSLAASIFASLFLLGTICMAQYTPGFQSPIAPGGQSPLAPYSNYDNNNWNDNSYWKNYWNQNNNWNGNWYWNDDLNQNNNWYNNWYNRQSIDWNRNINWYNDWHNKRY